MKGPEDGACGFSPPSTSQAPLPYLLSQGSVLGEFRKLSRGFFSWTSLIEPCQEKIISWKGSRLFAGEQKKREGEGRTRGRESKCEGKEAVFFLGAKSSPKNAICVCLAQGRGSKFKKQPQDATFSSTGRVCTFQWGLSALTGSSTLGSKRNTSASLSFG